MAESRKPGQQRDIRLGKKLSWLLRHGAQEQGFHLIDGCYLNVDQILAHREFKGFTREDIVRVVDCNNKRRYDLRTGSDGGLQIRAVQGHSMKVDGLDLVDITPETCHQYPTVVHGTYTRHWNSIARKGLSRMNRTHIHFTPGESVNDSSAASSGVISGLRRSADVLIYVDLPRALADGYKFSVSRNNVILCEGNEQGLLPAAYFKEVWRLRPYRLLIFADGKPHE